MPMNLKQGLGTAAQAAMAFLAAQKAGPLAAAAFLQGIQQANAQAAEGEQEQTRFASQEARLANQEGRADFLAGETQRMNDATLARQGQTDKREALDRLLAFREKRTGELASTYDDPLAAQNTLAGEVAMMGQELGTTPGVGQGLPNMAGLITKRMKADAAEWMKGVQAAAARNKVDYSDETFGQPWDLVPPSLQKALLATGHPEGQAVKMSEVERIAGFDISGPKIGTKTTTPGSFEDYLGADPARRTEIESARKKYMQADDRPLAPRDPVTVTIQTQDDQGRPVTRVVPRSEAIGKDFPMAPGALERMAKNRFATAEPVIASIEELSERINTQRGVIATIVGTAEKALAQANLDDDVTEYQALVSGFTPLVARALGHTGVLTEQDVQSVRALFPAPRDSKTVRDRKVARIRKILEGLTTPENVSESAAPPVKSPSTPIDDAYEEYLRLSAPNAR